MFLKYNHIAYIQNATKALEKAEAAMEKREKLNKAREKKLVAAARSAAAAGAAALHAGSTNAEAKQQAEGAVEAVRTTHAILNNAWSKAIAHSDHLIVIWSATHLDRFVPKEMRKTWICSALCCSQSRKCKIKSLHHDCLWIDVYYRCCTVQGWIDAKQLLLLRPMAGSEMSHVSFGSGHSDVASVDLR